MMKILIYILIEFILIEACAKRSNCYASSYCQKQSIIKPHHLSKMTCFHQKLDFIMGTNKPIFKFDFESPTRNVSLKPFCIDQTEVSNHQFLQFVELTKYKTEAEILGDSFCFLNFLAPKLRKNIESAALNVPWWVVIKNITWYSPEGEEWSVLNKMDHPVIHVSWNDADSYCKFFNKRLPTEAEWEYSCRGGLQDRLYAWGNNPVPNGKHRMNIWQGHFPFENLALDGFKYTSPVHKFNQNKFNMKNILGNVWEWVSDWWDEEKKDKVKKGGSFLCTKNFCHRYRCAARSKNTPDTSAMNIGFRCARDIS